LKNFYILTDALEYIEDNLCEEMSQENIASTCYCSLSSLQKLFRYVFHVSIKEYISKRRLTHAAKELINTDDSIIDIALKYQYNSHEVFTRAFTKLWGKPPQTFRSKERFAGLFPKIEFNYDGGKIIMAKRKFDVSELYDELQRKRSTYVLCFDIVNLISINNISYEAGDKAILECLRRIDENSNDEMLLFRVGGDEFVLVTGLEDIEEVNKIAKKIINLNGTLITHNYISIPLSLHCGEVKLDYKNIRYSELFPMLSDTIDRSKGKKETAII
jgi:AraC family transcriptional regulator